MISSMNSQEKECAEFRDTHASGARRMRVFSQISFNLISNLLIMISNYEYDISFKLVILRYI